MPLFKRAGLGSVLGYLAAGLAIGLACSGGPAAARVWAYLVVTLLAVALVLAIGALVAGGTGLALVTRRGRGEPPEGPSGRAETVARHAR